MKIIVVGCGKIGSAILASLVYEGHDVVALDCDPAVLDVITNIYDVMSICGNGTDYETLREAGADKCQLFVAVTGSDELNMLSCFIAKKMGAQHTIARTRNPRYSERSLSFMRQQLGLSMSINPEQLAAQELFKLLKLPSAAKVETFSRRNFEMVELRLKEDSPICNLSLMELRDKYRAKFLICAVQRGSQVHIPDGNFVLCAGDRIGLTAAPAEIHKLLKAMGILRRQARNIMILGGSKTAYYLAKMLTGTGSNVKIIEKNSAVCHSMAESLPNAVVIHGDGAKQELLVEEGIGTQDAFVALTGMDEENILLSFFAASQNVPKVISKVNRDEMASMADNLGLECIISPKKLIADILLRYARALENSMGSSVETLYKLMDGKAEALEFIVRGESRLTGQPIKKLNIKPHILIAGIIRDRKSVIPTGDDVILPGDRVVVLAANQRLQDLSDILK